MGVLCMGVKLCMHAWCVLLCVCKPKMHRAHAHKHARSGMAMLEQILRGVDYPWVEWLARGWLVCWLIG